MAVTPVPQTFGTMEDLLAQVLNDPAVAAFGTAVLLAVTALWLVAAWWAYADATRRTESSLAGFVAAGWVILSTPFLLPLSLAVYAFARPQVPAADARTRRLAMELAMTPVRLSCHACAAPIEDSWLRCPTCTTWLAAPCSHCGGWSEATLEICPWCGGEGRDAPYVEAINDVTTQTLRVGDARGADGVAAVVAGTGEGDGVRTRRRLSWRPTPSVPRSQRRDDRRPTPAPGAPRPAFQRVHP